MIRRRPFARTTFSSPRLVSNWVSSIIFSGHSSNSQVIRIEGHADERGTEAYNQELGQRRAEAVRDLLISKGVSASQIQTVSYGEKNPDITGSGEPVWQKNRRVVLK